MHRPWRRALVTAATLFAFADLSAQRPAPAPSPLASPDSVRIYLMTMGQGESVPELFGHNGLWVHDPSAGPDVVYNWGVYDFKSPGFVRKFLIGNMRYRMAGWPFDGTMAFYRERNRTVWAQELNLTATEKAELVAFLRWNDLPENQVYRYDYYRDNCSTRTRDALDRVLHGAVAAHLKAIPTDGETYRGHSLRLMQHNILVSGVEMALGRPTDVVLTAYETSFLPGQLMKHLGGLKLDGGTRPLLGNAVVMYEATRAPEPTTIPALWKGMLPVGLVLAALVLLPGLIGSPGAVRTQATVVAILVGFFGLIGTILLFLATLTDHVAAHWNENMFLLNPLWLVLAVLVPMAITRGKASPLTRRLVMAASVLAICAVGIHLIGMSRQPNWDVIGLVLPLELAISFSVLRRLPR